MAYIPIPSEALAPGARASSHLALALRSNRLFHTNALQVFGQRLASNLRGHLHRDPEEGGDYSDRFRVVVGENDSLNFTFRGAKVPLQTVTAIVEAGDYNALSLAAALQEKMRAATVPENQQIFVGFLPSENNPFRGQFVIRHSGTLPTDRLSLLWASGVNATDTIAPLMGFTNGVGTISDQAASLEYTAQQYVVSGWNSTTFEVDAIEYFGITAGLNDKLDFRFQGTAVADQTVTATLTAGTYNQDTLAAHVQTVLRAATTPDTTEISVSYEDDELNPSHGHFTIAHTGVSGTRLLELLGATGGSGPLNDNRSGYPTLGFAQRDRKGALAYNSDQGYVAGSPQDVLTVGDGGRVDTDGIENLAVTSVKLMNGIIETRMIPDGALDQDNILPLGIPGLKQRTGTVVLLPEILAGAYYEADVSIPYLSSAITGFDPDVDFPYATVWTEEAIAYRTFSIYVEYQIPTDDWRFTVANHSLQPLTGILVIY